MLCMIPDDYLDPDAVLNAMIVDEEDILGPSKDFVSELCEEDDDGRIIPLGRSCRVLAIDLADESLSAMSEYDPVTHDFDSCASFDVERPAAVPAVTDVFPEIKSWIEGVTETRPGYIFTPLERSGIRPKRSPIMPSWSIWPLCRRSFSRCKPNRKK